MEAGTAAGPPRPGASRPVSNHAPTAAAAAVCEEAEGLEGAMRGRKQAWKRGACERGERTRLNGAPGQG